MPSILIVFIVSFLCWLPPVHSATWEPFSPMERDAQNIVIPSGASRSIETLETDDWPQTAPAQWQEDKERYTVSLPLRLPDDADTRLLTYTYSDGVLKVTAPKKKFKSII